MKTFAIVLGLMAALLLLLFLSCVVAPNVNAHRLHTFCDDIHVGEHRDAVWNRGSPFDREQAAGSLDFSVSVPGLGPRIWHCAVSLNSNGLVLQKSLACED